MPGVAHDGVIVMVNTPDLESMFDFVGLRTANGILKGVEEFVRPSGASQFKLAVGPAGTRKVSR